MKKSVLFFSALLALASLSGCALAYKVSSNLPVPSSSPASEDVFTNRRRFDFEEEDDDFDFDYEDDSSDSSSFSSSSDSSSSSSSSVRDRGQAIEALTDMGDIPEWESFKSIVITPYTLGTNQTATSKEQIRAMFGEPTEAEEKSDFWRQLGRGVVVSYDNNGNAMDKMLMIADDRIMQEAPSDIRYGMTPREVLDRLGRPNIISSQILSTTFYWQMPDEHYFVVSFMGEKVLSSRTMNAADDSQ